jgi:hypothetical protein
MIVGLGYEHIVLGILDVQSLGFAAGRIHGHLRWARTYHRYFLIHGVSGITNAC